MTLTDFSKIFAVLAKQLRATDADEMDIRAYYAALKGLDLELVAMAATRIGQEGGSQGDNPHWFPKTSEWKAMAAKIEHERRDEQRAVILKRLKQGLQPLCSVCEDTGWARDPNDRVSPCHCRQQRRREILGLRPMPMLESWTP